MQNKDETIENEYQKLVTKYENEYEEENANHKHRQHFRHHNNDNNNNNNNNNKDEKDKKSKKKKSKEGDWNMYLGDMGYGKEWSGICHNDISKSQNNNNHNNNNNNLNNNNNNNNNNLKTNYALLQKNDGKFTILNKASGKGYIGFSVGNKPKMILDPQGNFGIGIYNPKSKLHVGGDVKSDDSYLVCSEENLSILRGGFSCVQLEFKSGCGFIVDSLEDSLFEVHFTDPFSKRPSVFAVVHTPQTTPSLIPIVYVDNTKFGFYENSGKREVRLFVIFILGLIHIIFSIFYLNLFFYFRFSFLLLLSTFCHLFLETNKE